MLNPDRSRALEEMLAYEFSSPNLLRRALTHRSFSADHNERLEFLGDGVLNLCISHWLMERLPKASEGELSRTRANLVREESLHRIAMKLQLSEALLLGDGEKNAGGRNRASILADAVEALIGAVYLDRGFDAANALVGRLFQGVDLSTTADVVAKDSKTALQEWLQGQHKALPEYQVVDIQGADHQQVFFVSCNVPSLGLQTQGSGASRKVAEQKAAAEMLSQLKQSKSLKKTTLHSKNRKNK